MVTKYIIQMTHHRAIGDDVPYYYKGKMKTGEPVFDYRKNTAARFTDENEAIAAMQALATANGDDFSVVPVRCKA